MSAALSLVISIIFLLALFVLGGEIERLRPAITSGVDTKRFNTVYACCLTVFSAAVEPLLGLNIAHLSRLSHLPIRLPSGGWRILLSATILLTLKDLTDYWLHRSQHRFPFMWAMHSFHHSDHAMNVTTSQRHFWLEKPVFMAMFYVPVGVLFSFSRGTGLLFAGCVMFFSLFPHLNLRLELGSASWLILGPQLHRKHHSARREDYDCNFAGIFPIIDVLFGTYKPPRCGEFPMTGIGEDIHPSAVQAILWPIRQGS